MSVLNEQEKIELLRKGGLAIETFTAEAFSEKKNG